MRTCTVWTLLLALFFTGCARNRPYRVHYPDASGVPVPTAPESGSKPLTACGDAQATGEGSYKLAFVEFDDQGEIYVRGQLQQALKMIGDAQEQAKSAKSEIAVLTFVHGWKNNASDRSKNVKSFRQMLACFADQFSPGPVVGVYIGWQGESIRIPGVKQLTYWGRRNVSATLPNAHFTEALKEIMLAGQGAYSLMLGHSFGGGLLKAGLTQTLINGLLDSKKEVQWPANLIVFVNEASPALLSYQLIEVLQRRVKPIPACGKDAVGYSPAIVSIASRGDRATRAFFPFAQAISRPFHWMRGYPAKNSLGVSRQSRMYYTTAPHSRQFQSHVLDRVDSTEVLAAEKAGCIAYTQHNLQEGNYKLVQLPTASNRTPYWVVQMPASIVPDHGGIFEPAFQKILIDLLLAQRVPGGKLYERK